MCVWVSVHGRCAKHRYKIRNIVSTMHIYNNSILTGELTLSGLTHSWVICFKFTHSIEMKRNEIITKWRAMMLIPACESRGELKRIKKMKDNTSEKKRTYKTLLFCPNFKVKLSERICVAFFSIFTVCVNVLFLANHIG